MLNFGFINSGSCDNSRFGGSIAVRKSSARSVTGALTGEDQRVKKYLLTQKILQILVNTAVSATHAENLGGKSLFLNTLRNDI